MVRLQRDVLLAGNFAFCMKLLQHYPTVELKDLRAEIAAVAAEERDAPSGAALAGGSVRVAAAAGNVPGLSTFDGVVVESKTMTASVFGKVSSFFKR